MPRCTRRACPARQPERHAEAPWICRASYALKPASESSSLRGALTPPARGLADGLSPINLSIVRQRHHLAAAARPQRPPNGWVDRVVDVLHVAVHEQEIDAVDVRAPEIIDVIDRAVRRVRRNVRSIAGMTQG